MKEIELYSSKAVALIDDCDYEVVSKYRWYLGNQGYAVSNNGRLLMHRLILNVPKGMLTDHKNENRLDNTRGNIRIASKAQNEMNKGVPSHNKLGIKGLIYEPHRGKYAAYIKLNGRKKHLGRFTELGDAIQARRNAEKRLFGEFAYQYHDL